MAKKLKKLKIGVSGDKGSFSEQAGKNYAKSANIDNPEIIFATDMKGVLKKVENNKVDVGVFPVHNTLGGFVDPAFEAMGNYKFSFIGQLKLPIHHSLMVLGNLKKENIQEIVSHSQPFRQCKEYIKKYFPDTPLREYIDMAKAARDLSKGIIPKTSGVIGSSNAALEYGLTILEEKIEDGKPGENVTTFIVVKRNEK